MESVRIHTCFLANSTSVTWSKSDKSFFTPWTSPWILDFPGSIDNTNQQNRMINVFTTITENTWWIVRPSSSIDSYGNWPSLKSILDSWASTGFCDSVDLECTALFFATLCNSFVWVIWFSCDSVVFDVF